MIEVCIIGFGFSSIPLIRELERTKTEFQIIAGEYDSVWDRLDKSGRLDFNLVSSYPTSFYSFDLVKNYEENYYPTDKQFYPTAKQFYEVQKRWRSVYEDRVVRDFVLRIDNFKDHSLISTCSGQTFQAKHVVVATGFSRLMNKFLNEFDYNVSNKTFVFGTMGDSANLIISKLIPKNNKIIIRMKGFTVLDQQVNISGKTFNLDQGEYQNGRYISHQHYGAVMTSVMHRYPKAKHPALLFNQFPLVNRDYTWATSKLSPPNGSIAVKYWPIEQYCRNFGDDLEGSISEGYLLNDIAMWIHTGKVIIVPPNTPIDFDKKTITYAGVKKAFHEYIKGDAEQPRLPEIMIDGVTPYQYLYRDNFVGIIPQKLRNIYLLGFTRPFTGGSANIIEMQGLFIHKLLTQPEFHQKIHQNLNERIAAYNKYYYGITEPRKTDHTIHFGFYTDDVARLIGIDYKPNECRSLKDLVFYYSFPNNALKYRLKGEYAVEGIEKLIEKINSENNNFITIFSLMINAGCKDVEDIPEWMHTTRHFFFNDMRYKESYREFLDTYINTYRRVKNISVDEIVDEEWETMANQASSVRDKVADEIEKNTNYQLDEDIANGIELILSLLDSDISSLPNSNDGGKSEFDAKRIGFIRSIWKPMEYDLPYLHD